MTCTPWTEWENKAKSSTDDALAFIVADCRKAAEAMRGWNPEKEGFYSDQAATFQMEVNRRKVA
jgi:hypothetical protein